MLRSVNAGTWTQLTFKAVSENCRNRFCWPLWMFGVSLLESVRGPRLCVCVSFSPALWPRLFLLVISGEKGVELDGFTWSKLALEVGASAFFLLHRQQNTLTALATAISRLLKQFQ